MTLTATRRVFASSERQRLCPAEFLKPLWLNYAFERPCDFIPSLFIGKKRLRDAEGSTVVVAVNEPRRHSCQRLLNSPYSLLGL